MGTLGGDWGRVVNTARHTVAAELRGARAAPRVALAQSIELRVWETLAIFGSRSKCCKRRTVVQRRMLNLSNNMLDQHMMCGTNEQFCHLRQIEMRSGELGRDIAATHPAAFCVYQRYEQDSHRSMPRGHNQRLR